MEEFCVVVIIGIIGFLCYCYYAYCKSTKTESDSGSEPIKDPVLGKDEPIRKQAENQVTIYKYNKPVGVKTCMFCDGENRIGDRYCRICGKQIDG